MPSASTQRALRGACEGAGIGLVVAILRAGLKLARDGVPADLGSHVPELVVYIGVHVIVTAYVVSAGRLIANGLAGALLGTALLAIGGAAIGGSLPADVPADANSVLVGAALGVLIGAPAGAGIQRAMSKRRSPASAAATSRVEDE